MAKQQKRKVGKSCPEPPSGIETHPTVVALQAAATKLTKAVEAVGEPIDFGGVHALDLPSYKRLLKRDGVYECCVPIWHIDLLQFAHKSIPPGQGSVKIMKDRHFVLGQRRAWQETIVVRATSMSEPPEPGRYEVCNGDAYRAAFWESWAAAPPAETKAYLQMARSVRVSFQYLPDQMQFERKKWELAEQTGDAADALTLQGYRRMCAISLVEEMLKGQGLQHSPEALEKWFAEGKVQMKAKTIQVALKIHRRIQGADARVRELIASLDDRFASKHILATTQGLEALTTKCFIATSPAVSNSLILWTAEHLVSDVNSGILGPNESKAGVFLAMNRALLKRRIANYTIKKLSVPESEGGGPKFASSFSSMESFRASGLCLNQDAASSTWVGELPPFQVEAVGFLAKMLQGSDTLDKVINDLVSKDQNMQPEVFYQSADFQRSGLFDFQGALTAQQEWRTSKAAPAPVVAPAEPQPAAVSPVHDEAIAAEEPEATVEEPEPTPARLDRKALFEPLEIPELVADILARPPEDAEFENIYDWARLRVKSFVDVRLAPAPAEWRRALSSLVEETPEAGSRMWIYDVKRHRSATPVDGVLCQQPWKRTPVLNNQDFRFVTHARLGDPAVAKAHQAVAGAPLLRDVDCFLALDGRTVSNGPTMIAEINKTVKACCPDLVPKRPVTSIRLVHHTRELALKALTARSPEPIESLLCIFPKKYKLPPFEGVPDGSHISVGDVRQRVWSNLSMKTDQSISLTKVSTALCQKILGSGPQLGSVTAESDSEEEENGDKPADSSVRLLFPWESPEDLHELIYKAYCHRHPGNRIIDLNPGSGLSALAAARLNLSYITFASTECHRAFILQFVTLHVVLENILGKNNGFRMKKRILTREGSLTGQEALPTGSATASTPPSTKKPKSSSSSSSS